MKTIFKDLRHGLVKVKLENPDDLWHLEKILEPGDLVTGRTLRRTTVKRGQEIGKGDRRPVTLTLSLEKIQRETGSLRLTGKITEGPEDVQISSYHSIVAEPGLVLKIRKKAWKTQHLDRLKKAAIRQALIFVCVLDREEADFASVTDSGVQMRGSIRFRKVWGEDDRTGYYAEVLKAIEQAEQDHQAVVVAGPGFEKENLLEFMDKKNPGLAAKVALEYASDTGSAGVQEVIKRSAFRILKQHRIAQETALVEKLLEEIGKDGLAVYGPKHTEQAAEMGAIETLLVSEEKVQESEHTMEAAEKHRGRVFIISGGHESGEKFLGLGGIAGFLRFRIS
jgi:protein pelota